MVLDRGPPIATLPRVPFIVNAGGGVKVPVDDTWGIRTDVRWFESFGKDAAVSWRVAHGVSFGAGSRGRRTLLPRADGVGAGPHDSTF